MRGSGKDKGHCQRQSGVSASLHVGVKVVMVQVCALASYAPECVRGSVCTCEHMCIPVWAAGTSV